MLCIKLQNVRLDFISIDLGRFNLYTRCICICINPSHILHYAKRTMQHPGSCAPFFQGSAPLHFCWIQFSPPITPHEWFSLLMRPGPTQLTAQGNQPAGMPRRRDFLCQAAEIGEKQQFRSGPINNLGCKRHVIAQPQHSMYGELEGSNLRSERRIGNVNKPLRNLKVQLLYRNGIV